MEDYLICYHPKFESLQTLNKLKYPYNSSTAEVMTKKDMEKIINSYNITEIKKQELVF